MLKSKPAPILFQTPPRSGTRFRYDPSRPKFDPVTAIETIPIVLWGVGDASGSASSPTSPIPAVILLATERGEAARLTFGVARQDEDVATLDIATRLKRFKQH
jgi:hypothetical protein